MLEFVRKSSGGVRRGRRLLNSPVSMLVLVAGLTLFAGAVAAQPINAPVYRIRADDSLSITVAGHQEWSLQVNVRPDGRITYPATGEINVAGLTLGELTHVLTRALGPDGRHLRDPQVFINVTGMRSLVAYVLGAVKKPGAVELPQGIGRLATVLTMAGGIAPEGDLAQITLYRGDGSSAIIDLEAELSGDA